MLTTNCALVWSLVAPYMDAWTASNTQYISTVVQEFLRQKIIQDRGLWAVLGCEACTHDADVNISSIHDDTKKLLCETHSSRTEECTYCFEGFVMDDMVYGMCRVNGEPQFANRGLLCCKRCYILHYGARVCCDYRAEAQDYEHTVHITECISAPTTDSEAWAILDSDNISLYCKDHIQHRDKSVISSRRGDHSTEPWPTMHVNTYNQIVKDLSNMLTRISNVYHLDYCSTVRWASSSTWASHATTVFDPQLSNSCLEFRTRWSTWTELEDYKKWLKLIQASKACVKLRTVRLF